jgi:hypothetical protein
MKVVGLIIAGVVAAIAQSASASVIFMPSNTDQTVLDHWGQARTMTVQAQPNTAGPIEMASGVTFNSTSASSVVGYVGGYGFASNGAWSAGETPMAGLNTSLGEMTFDFAGPVASVMAELNWAPGYSDGAPIFISAFDVDGLLLETYQLTDRPDGDLTPGFYGFQHATADISRLVMSNGYIGARRFYTQGGYSGGGFGGFRGEAEVGHAPVPEPATWAMMIVGFGASGLMLRRARRPAPITAAA